MTESTLDKVKRAYIYTPVFSTPEQMEDAYLREFKVHYFKDIAQQESVINDLIHIFTTSGHVENGDVDRKFRATARSILANAFHFLKQDKQIEVIKAFNDMIPDPVLGFETLRVIESFCRIYFPANEPQSQSLKNIFNKDVERAIHLHVSKLSQSNPCKKEFRQFLAYIQTLQNGYPYLLEI